MLRLRRYRYYSLLAAVVVFLLYRVARNSGQWEAASASFSHAAPPFQPKSAPPTNIDAHSDDDLPRQILRNTGDENNPTLVSNLDTTHQDSADDNQLHPIPPPDPAPVKEATVLAYDHDEAIREKTVPIMNAPGMSASHGFQGSDNPFAKSTTTGTHWEKVPENYPVPESDIIPLPIGKPRKIPTIQYAFEKESSENRETREARQQKVKAEMERSWAGYWTYARGHDELSPVTGKFRDPFCGWAATLVDSLDTLWIMGMEDEFEEALSEVEKIDFTIAKRTEIPVFETTIRYLGGLLAAYDVSLGKKGGYDILLQKARELAEILMGAFDTPNRMPILYYRYTPQSVSQPKRASTRVSIAELGSLAMEFTRLAQLTQENKYYDAVARITDALYEWQNRGTSIPGIFPELVDASGCNRTALNELKAAQSAASPEINSRRSIGVTGNDAIEPEYDAKPEPGKGENDQVKSPMLRRSGESASLDWKSSSDIDGSTLPACIAQGLTAGGWGSEQYSMGGSQDSTYEYFPKQWLLLGGLEPKYKELHLKVSEAVKKWLLYKPMLPDERDALFSAKVQTRGHPETDITTQYEVTHLTCFIGGMFGMAGKIFQIPADVEIGRKLTEGCVWAYESTPTGIMPEVGSVLSCADAKDCHWNTTRYEEGLDPFLASRDQMIEDYEARKAKAKLAEEEEKEANKLTQDTTSSTSQTEHPENGHPGVEQSTGPGANHEIRKRAPVSEVGDLERDEAGSYPATDDEIKSSHARAMDFEDSDPAPGFERVAAGQAPIQADEDRAERDPRRPLTHEEFVAKKIKDENLPKGFLSVDSSSYILRPEAIESVWYMYRITGEKKWQEKGWKMFEAIVRYTTTELGNSAIDNVLSTDTEQLDQMESFWTAETLKYFYLLYSEPNVISLDHWVLNTEAHPFKRPKT
ncbi:glycoside hydrolase family 47 protein [Xylaria sp. CBS 124048]|nr:glycoside hydrolase family 47 protein [Xylaria sp. CBS 124048]